MSRCSCRSFAALIILSLSSTLRSLLRLILFSFLTSRLHDSRKLFAYSTRLISNLCSNSSSSRACSMRSSKPSPSLMLLSLLTMLRMSSSASSNFSCISPDYFLFQRICHGQLTGAYGIQLTLYLPLLLSCWTNLSSSKDRSPSKSISTSIICIYPDGTLK